MTEPQKTDYSSTVHLPATPFPMKAGLAQREPLQLQAWEKAGAYEGLRRARKGAPKWILHDGPPFANGDLHMGHALNKVLKDLLIRYKSMRGFDVPYVPGWDCHGLPIESKVLKNWPKEEPRTTVAVRGRCREEADKWIGRQKEQFKRLGVWGDWDNAYATMDKSFEAAELDVYWKVYQSGQMYRGLKPVHWCVFDQTALAEAELEYGPHTSDSVTVKFRLDPAASAKLGLKVPAYALIWTTTPWTLPANLAIAVNPDFEYEAYQAGDEAWLVAKDLHAEVFARSGQAVGKVLWSGKGRELENLEALHPFIDRVSRLVTAAYVTLDAGTTGLVHTAPGHGADDFATGLRYGLPALNPVDARGCYESTVGVESLVGLRVIDPATNAKVIEILKEKGALVRAEKLQHSYPHCWRCKNPIIFRATEQWFISLDANGFKEKALSEIRKVRWITSWGQERMHNVVKDRPDWCVSRQRGWGVPIYMYFCGTCGKPHFPEASYQKLKAAVEKEGSDAWFQRPMDFLPAGERCPHCQGSQFKPETDTLDVWFDSGSTHEAVLRKREGLAFPADLYFEGSDQYRAWFQASLLVSVAVHGTAPYKAVLSHGWVLDEKGKAMHKSAGNVVEPQKVIEKYGADVVRLWAASENFMEDLGIGEDILKRVADSYRRVRNTFRWLLGSLDGYVPGPVDTAGLEPVDRWLLQELDKLVEACTGHLEAFEFQRFTAAYVQFCAVQLSSLVFDVHKDSLYTLSKNDPRRLSAQAALYQVLQTLVRLGAPVLAFTCEEAWSVMPEAWKDAPSVHLGAWPQARPQWRDAALAEEFSLLLDIVRPVVTKKLEEARAAGTIGHPYDAQVSLKVHSKKLHRLLETHQSRLAYLFVVSKVILEPAAPRDGLSLDPAEVEVTASAAEKCLRCWRRPGDTGSDPSHPGLCTRCLESLEGDGHVFLVEKAD